MRKPEIVTRANKVRDVYDPVSGLFFTIREDYVEGGAAYAAVQHFAEGLVKSSAMQCENIPRAVAKFYAKAWRKFYALPWYRRLFCRRCWERAILGRTLRLVTGEP